MIPYGRQDITQADIDAVIAVLRSEFLTQGPMVPRFERAVADYCGARHAVAVNSATSALHIACLALGVGPGDRVWTSPITFVASANCVLYCGGKVDFVDIDPHTYNMSTERLAEKLAQAENTRTLPKVVIPVHFAGQPCDLVGIHALSQRYGFRIIEDASHAIGGRYRGQPVGNGRYSDITVFSFHPVKIITTGEGGMVLTRHPGLYEKLQLLRSHGITRDPRRMGDEMEGPWYYQQIDLGYNFRMTDIQAALGASQMQRLDQFVAHRHSLAERYNNLLRELPVIIPWQQPDTHSAFHLYVIQVDSAKTDKTRRQVFESLRRAGIGVNVHYIPVHTQPYYRELGFIPSDFPAAEHYYERVISLPMFPGISKAQQDTVAAALRESLR